MNQQASNMENRILGEIGVAVDTRGDLFFDTLQSQNQLIDRFQYIPYRLYIYPYSSYANIKRAIFMQLLDEDGRELVLQRMQKLAADMTQIRWQRNQLLLQNPFLPTTYWLWSMIISRWEYFTDQLRFSQSKHVSCYVLFHIILKFVVTNFLKMVVGFTLLPICLIWDIMNGKVSMWQFLTTGGKYVRVISDEEKKWIQSFIVDNNSIFNQLAFEKYIERTMHSLIQEITLNVIIMSTDTSMKPLLTMTVKKRVEQMRSWSCHCNTNNDITSFFGISSTTSLWLSSFKAWCDKKETHFEDNLFEWMNTEFQLYVIQFYHNFESDDEMNEILRQMGVINTPSPLIISSASSFSSLSRHNSQSDDNDNDEESKIEPQNQKTDKLSYIFSMQTTESMEEKKSMDLESGEISSHRKKYVYSPVRKVENQKNKKKSNERSNNNNKDLLNDNETTVNKNIFKEKHPQMSATEYLRKSGKSPLSILTSSQIILSKTRKRLHPIYTSSFCNIGHRIKIHFLTPLICSFFTFSLSEMTLHCLHMNFSKIYMNIELKSCICLSSVLLQLTNE